MAAHELGDLRSYEELEEFLRAGWADSEGFDFVGNVHLMLATLDYLMANASRFDDEVFRDCVSDEQARFLQRMVKGLDGPTEPRR